MRDEVIPEVKNPKLSSWDVVYALNMAIACLITYWIMTHTLSRLSTSLPTSWAGCGVVATVFVFRETRLGSLSAGIARLIATCVSFALCCSTSRSSRSSGGDGALIALGTLAMALLGRRDDIVTVGITTAVVMVVAAIPADAWQQPLLRLADTVGGDRSRCCVQMGRLILFYRLFGKQAQ